VLRDTVIDQFKLSLSWAAAADKKFREQIKTPIATQQFGFGESISPPFTEIV